MPLNTGECFNLRLPCILASLVLAALFMLYNAPASAQCQIFDPETEACLDDLDDDQDGVTNINDQCPNDPGPAANDGCPLPDRDDDGVPDKDDNCPDIANSDQMDIDNDGAGDACDAVNDLDVDGDGVDNSDDNCPDTSNPGQADIDADGLGDACDLVDDTDSDGDGIRDFEDNCPSDANIGQADKDNDGLGDVCDAINDLDTDADGVENTQDNCPDNSNPAQVDTDGDGLGDACDLVDDTDSDDDGIRDTEDNCPDDANSDQADSDNDGIGDACEATEEEVESTLNDFTPQNDPSVGATAGAIANACTGGRILNTQLQEDCDALVIAAGGSDSNVSQALRRITPRAAVESNQTVRQGGQTQNRNLGARLASLRSASGGGGGVFSLNGFNLRMGGQTLAFGRLATALDDGEDSAAQKTDAGIRDSRLGIFIIGDIGPGEREATDSDPGFEFETYGLTTGVDYRFSDTLVIGAAFGYLNADTDLDDDLGDLDTTGYSLSMYGSYFPADSFYIDFSATYGENEFDQSRIVAYGLGSGLQVNQVMNADYDGDMLSITIGSGYDFRFGAWEVGPRANVEYLQSNTDSFTERASSPGAAGAGWAVQIDDYEQDWTTLELGIRLAYTAKTRWGILIPYGQFDWLHEFEEDSLVILGRFAADPNGRTISIITEEQDANYFRARLGASAQFANGVAGFFDYSTTISEDLWDRDKFSFGVRWEF